MSWPEPPECWHCGNALLTEESIAGTHCPYCGESFAEPPQQPEPTEEEIAAWERERNPEALEPEGR